jgi:hypothetical protein
MALLDEDPHISPGLTFERASSVACTKQDQTNQKNTARFPHSKEDYQNNISYFTAYSCEMEIFLKQRIQNKYNACLCSICSMLYGIYITYAKKD